MIKYHDTLAIMNNWFTIATALWVKTPVHSPVCGFTQIKWSCALELFIDRLQLSGMKSNACFRLAYRFPHCHFDDDICSTAQAPLAAEGWPSGKQRLANRSITLLLCPLWQTADSWILFNSGVMISQSSMVAESCNSETASDDHKA